MKHKSVMLKPVNYFIVIYFKFSAYVDLSFEVPKE